MTPSVIRKNALQILSFEIPKFAIDADGKLEMILSPEDIARRELVKELLEIADKMEMECGGFSLPNNRIIPSGIFSLQESLIVGNGFLRA